AGLTAYIDNDLQQRFRDFIGTFNANGEITADKLPKALDDFRVLVKHRLMLAKDWANHPEIGEEKIDNPFFIIGTPRTGTTILQCLLGEDSHNRILRYWQSHYPSPPPGIAPDSVQERIRLTDCIVEEITGLMPVMLPCHPYLDQGGSAELEDEEFYTLDFQS